MSCKICGRGACAAYMHSAEEQSEWAALEDMDEHSLRRDLIAARREISDLNATIARLEKGDENQ